MNRLRKRADRILQEVPLGDILVRYGYDIDSRSNQDQQFSCGLHGKDEKKSARFYPHTNSTYCWTCHRARDVIDYIRELEQVGFAKALDILEEYYGFPSLPWEDKPKIEKIDFSISEAKDPVSDTEKLLMWITKDKVLSMDLTLRYWEAFDLIKSANSDLKMRGLRSHILKSISST